MTPAAAPRTESALDRNLARLGPLLAQLESDGLPHLIDGAASPASSRRRFVNHSPVDRSMICEAASGDDTDIDRAAVSAERAFPAWRDVTPARRRDLLHAIADGIERRADDLA